MKTRVRLAGAALLLLSACFAPPPAPDPEVLRSLTDLQLCQRFAQARSLGWADVQGAVGNELRRRNALTAAQWADVEKQTIRTGMPEHVAICSWGPYRSINTMAGTFGRHNQFVLGDFGPYVYSENGRVTSWQARLR